MIAVNIADCTKDSIISEFLLGPVIKSGKTVEAERGKLDGGAVVLECDDDRAKAIVEIVRKSKNGKNWKRI